MPIQKISTLSEFNEVKNNKKGFIIISKLNFGTIHKVNCPYILEKHFLKSINKISESRDYFFVIDSDNLFEFKKKIQDCKQCNPYEIKLRFS